MKAWQKRLSLIIIAIAMLAAGVAIVLKVFNDNILFFYSPSDLKEKSISASSKKIRIGGLVKDGSITSEGDQLTFIITDLNKEITVTYQGIPPALFKEGQGAVILGTLQKDGKFKANEILAKHDENYMPKEVADSIKKWGQWKEGEKTY
jgi:cytochrome c-type biogenesis protein CcmE